MNSAVKFITIHWFVLDTKRSISSGCHAMSSAQVSRTAFLQKVCQLVSTSASPKHPQSLMGLAMASHSVSGVSIRSQPSMMRVTTRLRMANNRHTPSQNSAADSKTEAVRVMKSGMY